MFWDRSGSMIDKFLLVLTFIEWSVSVEELIKSDTEGPHICFLAVVVENKSFGRHVLGRAYIQIIKSLSKYLIFYL